ncbi:MAG: hypothetical protein EU529_10310 [Promethearchaeota archaeon]|nr:MAG: hypothetical protein EU529_10310 [Candidatus Lokiarchaeota archaeon]
MRSPNARTAGKNSSDLGAIKEPVRSGTPNLPSRDILARSSAWSLASFWTVPSVGLIRPEHPFWSWHQCCTRH